MGFPKGHNTPGRSKWGEKERGEGMVVKTKDDGKEHLDNKRPPQDSGEGERLKTVKDGGGGGREELRPPQDAEMRPPKKQTQSKKGQRTKKETPRKNPKTNQTHGKKAGGAESTEGKPKKPRDIPGKKTKSTGENA